MASAALPSRNNCAPTRKYSWTIEPSVPAFAEAPADAVVCMSVASSKRGLARKKPVSSFAKTWLTGCYLANCDRRLLLATDHFEHRAGIIVGKAQVKLVQIGD